MLDSVRSVRPRRACCGRCGSTHVLCPAWSVPRRRDGAEVIGEAVRVRGRASHDRRAARPPAGNGFTGGCGPPGAVRSRSAAQALAGRTRWTPSRERLMPAASPLGNAVEALATAARAWVLRLGHRDPANWPCS